MIDLLKHALDEEITAGGFSDTLRRHANDVPDDDVEHLATVLVPFLRSVPDALAWALGVSKDPRCGRSVAFATGSILHYLFDDEDLLPESSFGTLGLLDDAYLVHGFVATLARTFPFAEPTAVYSAPDGRAFEIVASLLPEGVSQSLLRTCESTVQVAQALFPPAQGNVAADSLYRPEIRVAKAARAASGRAGAR
ncbi:MAG: hypothetical protein ACRDK3_00125 [Actinomycetota bacterium]